MKIGKRFLSSNKTLYLLSGVLFFQDVVDAQINFCSDQLVVATLWNLRSREKKILLTRAYSDAARTALGFVQDTTDTSTAFGAFRREIKKNALILDIDETVLDNSDYRSALVRQNLTFDNASWHDWVLHGTPRVYPQAGKFISYAESLGYDIYYVSNRECSSEDCPERHATLASLLEGGVKPISKEFLMLRKNDADTKRNRYTKISESANIRLIIGDDAADHLWENSDSTEIESVADSKNHVLIPNPMYGLWDRQLGTCLTYRDSIGQGHYEIKRNTQFDKGDTAKLSFQALMNTSGTILKIWDRFLIYASVATLDGETYEWHGFAPTTTYDEIRNILKIQLHAKKDSIGLNSFLASNLDAENAGPGRLILKDTVMRLSKKGDIAQVDIKTKSGLNGASVRIYSNLIGFFGNTDNSTFQIDGRQDFITNSSIVNPYENKETGWIWLHRVSPYIYFPSVFDNKSRIDTSEYLNPIKRNNLAFTRYGVDLNLLSFYYLNLLKVRLDLMGGGINSPIWSYTATDTIPDLSNGFQLEPYLRFVLYGDRKISLHLIADWNKTWFSLPGDMEKYDGFWDMSYWTLSGIIEFKSGPFGTAPFFLKTCMQFQNTEANTLQPTIEIGYKFENIEDKVAALFK